MRLKIPKRLNPLAPFAVPAVLVLAMAAVLDIITCASALAQRQAYIAHRGGAGNDDRLAQASPNHKPPPLLQVPAFITYWGHDVSGYHPCIILALEGDGATDMAGLPVQLQAQFRVLAQGLLTVGRTEEVFPSVSSKTQQYVTRPMVGKRSFELEQDPNDWPVIECKVLAKVNDATDDEVQTLFRPHPESRRRQ